MTEVKRYVLQILVPMEASQDTIDQTLKAELDNNGVPPKRAIVSYVEAPAHPYQKRVTVIYDVDVMPEPPKKKKGKFEPELETK